MDNKSMEFLLKELDLIDSTISRLDTQMQTSKNICMTLWTAWLGWFVTQHINHENEENFGLAILASAVFPILFWLVDFEYRKALLSVSRRQNLISLYLNSRKDMDIHKLKGFPLLDPVGWLYDFNIDHLVKGDEFTLSEKQRKLLAEKPNWYSVLFYKEAKWIYLPLILVSIALGYYFW